MATRYKLPTPIKPHNSTFSPFGIGFNSPSLTEYKSPASPTHIEVKLPKPIPVVNFIGSGSYGCTYQPPLPCKNKRSKIDSKYIMKVLEPDEAKRELKMSKLLYMIDPKQNFYLYLVPEEPCLIDVPINQLESKCSQIKTNYEGYVMKYGGINLQEIAINQPERITLYQTIKWLHKLILAVQILQSIRIIHYDIKLGNLTVDDNNEIYMIDFGLSWQSSTLTDNLEDFNDSFYPIWPLFQNIISEKYSEIKQNYGAMPKGNQMIDTLSHEFMINKMKYMENIYYPNIFKIDIYSLGYVFMNHIYQNFKHKFKMVNPVLTVRLGHILNKMIDVDPDEQLNTKEAMRAITKLLSQIPKN